jgi:hypothetical protein
MAIALPFIALGVALLATPFLIAFGLDCICGGDDE